MEKYCLVAVNFPLKNSVLVYRQDPLLGDLGPGDLVAVPLGKRFEKGMVIRAGLAREEISPELPGQSIKTIQGLLEDSLGLGPQDLELLKWTSSYYHYSLGKLVFDCFPKREGKIKEPKCLAGQGRPLEFELNEEQKTIVSRLTGELSQGHQRYLIHGITGSGKTAIYLELINNVLKNRKSVLFLLPEINLTPQILKIFENFVRGPVYSYHSNVGKSAKWGIWNMLKTSSSPKTIVGTRSSIFLPITDLGLIIVDEEHDHSFKQEDRCPYHARDLAIKKAKLLNIPIVLGSATPSMESYWHHKRPDNPFQSQRNYLPLRQRIGSAALPKIEMVDIRQKGADEDLYWPLAKKSLEEIEKALKKKEQVLVFVNRLGFASFVQCRGCGYKVECINCSASLKFFKRKARLSCQFCDYSIPLPGACWKCGCLNLIQKGFGTEKIVEVLSQKFPEARIDRFDRDEVKTFKQLETKLQKFHQNEIDIFVGTQMLSKGHNFHKVNLVVILGIDSQLNFPDFRSGEKTFQLLTQVAGRSGRFGGSGLVLIQTMNPDNVIFEHIQNSGLDGFYQKESEFRNLCLYPPFTKLAVIYLTSKSAAKGSQAAADMKHLLDILRNRHFTKVGVFGPKPTLVEKRVNQYSWCLLLKGEDINELHNIIHSLHENFPPLSGITVKVDIDPCEFQ